MAGTWEEANLKDNPNWIPYRSENKIVNYGGKPLRDRIIKIIAKHKGDITTKEITEGLGQKTMNGGARGVLRQLVEEGVVEMIKRGWYRMAK